MRKIIPVGLLNVLLVLFLVCCKSPDKNSISSDPTLIAKGENSFTQNCSGCHNFRQEGIGPALSGITDQASAEWISHFIKDPKQVIEAGDERAQKLYKKYRTIMPSFFTLPKEEIDALIAFLNTHKGSKKKSDDDPTALNNPIPGSIKLSNLVVNLKLVTRFPSSSDSGKLPLTRITKMDQRPNNGGMFVLDLRGKLYRLENDQPVVYMDMVKLKPAFINKPGLATGFGSFAFHPDFAKNGLLYTTHTEPAGTAKADFDYADSIKVVLQWVVTEWKTHGPNAFPFSGQGRELFRVNMVQGIHGIQEIAFNPMAKKGDKDYALLYICIGDGGSVEKGYSFLVHSLEKIWGTILRIDPAGRNSGNGKYGIPSDNPFTKSRDEKTLKEIYAYGFRNPHRISWTHSGQMLACNIGLANIESLCIIKPGGDYGWPIREGGFLLNPNGNLSKVHPLPPDDSGYHITYPVAQYDHDEGKAISGGFEYLGKEVPQLKGKYFFGDIPTGRLFYVNMTDLKQGSYAPVMEWRVSLNGNQKTLREICGTDRVDLHFGKDMNGELYILTKPDGRMYKLVSGVD
jgi:glucose/arabinose dehydrogenase/mono/diheme cytochrome c family protein